MDEVGVACLYEVKRSPVHECVCVYECACGTATQYYVCIVLWIGVGGAPPTARNASDVDMLYEEDC